MARPGAGLLASGSSAAPSRGAVATPVAAICSAANAAELARDGCRPVTVAGPRRFLTGLPLATGRMWGRTLLAGPGARQVGRRGTAKKRGGLPGRPSFSDLGLVAAYYFCLHFWVNVPTATWPWLSVNRACEWSFLSGPHREDSRLTLLPR